MIATNRSYGDEFRKTLSSSKLVPMIGVYDVFSATIAAEYSKGIFISGFGFAASYYGLPDIGFNAWPDIVNFVQRVRAVLPDTCILVDIDDGFCDIEVACHVVSQLESVGASGVILEDQDRPRRCGHVGGKQVMQLDGYLEKLQRVLQTRDELVVVARTDATGAEEIHRRVQAFSQTDADAILVDGIDLACLGQILGETDKPLAFNQIVGGASPPFSEDELMRAGVSLAIFSTPCLFAAQHAIAKNLEKFRSCGRIDGSDSVNLRECNELLESNLRRRDSSKQTSAIPTLPRPCEQRSL